MNDNNTYVYLVSRLISEITAILLTHRSTFFPDIVTLLDDDSYK